MKKITIHIKKIDKLSSLTKLENKLRKIVGISKLEIDKESQEIKFKYDLPETLRNVFQLLESHGCKLSGCYNYLLRDYTSETQKSIMKQIYLKI